MKNKKNIIISIAALAAVISFFAISKYDISTSNESAYEVEEVRLNFFERRTRSASLKVVTPTGGHGTGTLMLYKGNLVIFTAAHVVQEGPIYMAIDEWGEQQFAVVAYTDTEADFAVLVAMPFQKTKPVKFRLPGYDIRNKIDLDVIFSGYPYQHSLLTNRGRVTGFEDRSMIINSAAWSGSSGSGVFDKNGHFVGVLYGVSVGPEFGGPAIMENFIWVMPFDSINWEELDETINALSESIE